MRRFPTASALIGATKPDIPIIGVRPHAAGRAARWFIQSPVFLIGALHGAGVRHSDVASLSEIEDAATVPSDHCGFKQAVQSRTAIRGA